VFLSLLFKKPLWLYGRVKKTTSNCRRQFRGLAPRSVTDTLARYDAFQLDENIKPDYCNAGGLSVFDDGEWVDWEDPEEFIDIDGWIPIGIIRIDNKGKFNAN